MEDDNEVLDWGNEDDEQGALERARRGSPGFANFATNDVDDAEDAVSLGGEEEDAQEYDSFHRQEFSSAVSVAHATSDTTSRSEPVTHDHHRHKSSDSFQKSVSTPTAANPPATLQSPSRPIIHALPPKPVAASVPFLHPSHPSIIEATAMSRGRDKKTGTNGAAKPLSSAESASGDVTLPPDWEIRYPRNGGRGQYYYNVRTHESTWALPARSTSESVGHSNGNTDSLRARTAISTRDEPASLHAARRSPPPVRLLDSYRPGLPSPPRPSRAPDTPVAGPLSYEDRHYRPGEDGPEEAIDTNNISAASNTRNLLTRIPPRRSRSPSPRPALQERVRDSSSRQSRSQRPSRKSDVRDGSPLRHYVPPRTPPADQGYAPQESLSRSDRDHRGGRDAESRDRRGNQPRNPEIRPAQEQPSQHAHNDSHNAPVSSRHRSVSPPARSRELPEGPPSKTTPSIGSVPTSEPPSSGKARDRPSRFDQPVVTSQKSQRSVTPSPRPAAQNQASYPAKPRSQDIYMPSADVDMPPARRARGAPLPDRRDRDEAISSFRPNDSHIDHPPQTQQPSYAQRDQRDLAQPAPQRDTSTTATPTSTPRLGTPPSDSAPRRPRAPLPPQALLFREDVHQKKAQAEQPAPFLQNPATLPPAPRDHPIRAVPPSGPALPSGPRSRDPILPPSMRDGEFPEPRRFTNQPSGNHYDRRVEQERRITADSSMDVDVDHYPSAPRGRYGRPAPDLNSRPPPNQEGTSVAADAPRGPRAMVTVSPTLPRSAHGQPPTAPWGSRDRSPPSYTSGPRRDRVEDYPVAPRQRQERREGEFIPRRANDGPPPIAPRAAEPFGPDPFPRREPRRAGRRPDTPLSGTNNVPIANKRAFVTGPTAPGKLPDAPIAAEPPSPPRQPSPPIIAMPRSQPDYPSDVRGVQESSRSMPVDDEYGSANRYPGRERPPYSDRILDSRGTSGARPQRPPSREHYYDGRPLVFDFLSLAVGSMFIWSMQPVNDYPSDQYRSSSARMRPAREPSPPRNARHPDPFPEDHRPATPPPPSREPSQTSTSWPQQETRERSRSPVQRNRKSRFGGPTDILPPQPQPVPTQTYRQSDYEEYDSRRGPTLQGRLGGRYPDEQVDDDRHSSVHASSTSSHHREPEKPSEFRQPRSEPSRWPDPQDEGHQGHRSSNDYRTAEALMKPAPDANLPPRPSTIQEEPRRTDVVAHESLSPLDSRKRSPLPVRPQAKRTGGSLLDRLSLDRGGRDAVMSDDTPSPSLRERVQVPTKRDRDEVTVMEKGVYERPADFDDLADADIAAKRRKRTARPKRGRRGGS
ncbi:hypothetical protein EYR40_003177 [Pleurotus pulmonarius]|nr:hypothetical protein EYR40_003177 [Pleurotus pulmonarius]